ncbi:MAG: hypothetical protein IJ501_05740 [Bacilli bacterium]|nr:hypothetical protein [Bacilli bacterium]
MKNKRNLIIIIILVAIILVGLFLSSGGSRTDVFLKDFELSQDGKTMTLKVGVSSSAGYIRKIKRTSGSMNYYFTFYKTFGINSKLGAKDTFKIELDNNVDEIYFYTGNKGYKKVLEKTDNNEWIKVSKIEVVKPEYYNDIKFNKYLERDNKTIYLAGNIEEIYYTDLDIRMSLNDYITKSYQTTDDSIKHLTDILDYVATLNDGGTTIYKSSEYDITVIKCNTISGNKDIFIGDYTMNFDSDLMCK